jgi:hypothetical protein
MMWSPVLSSTQRSRKANLRQILACALGAAACLEGAALAQELGIPQGSGVQAAASGTQAAPAAGRTVLMPALTAGAADQLSMLVSRDGANFISLASEVRSPPSGTLADPSLMRHADGRYYLAYANGSSGGGVGLARSADLRRWR